MKYDLNLEHAKIFSSIEIPDDLQTIKFNYSEEFINNYNLAFILENIGPDAREVGYVYSRHEYYMVCGMKDLSNITCTDNLPITEEKHTIEFILAKANKNNLIPNTIYTQILSDVQMQVENLRNIAAEKEAKFKEINRKYSEEKNFKKIITHHDVNEFAGKIIALRTNSQFFTAGITFVDPNDQLIRFAWVSPGKLRYGNGFENYEGFSMKVFIGTYDETSNHILSNKHIQNSSFEMRLATLDELNYLRLAQELNQGYFEHCAKETKIIISYAIASYLPVEQNILKSPIPMLTQFNTRKFMESDALRNDAEFNLKTAPTPSASNSKTCSIL